MTTPLPRETDDVRIRPLESEIDYAASVDLQRQIWGDAVGEIVPPAILLVSQKLGGIAAGAFEEEGKLVGFVFGMTGVIDGKLAHWSHLLAVHPERRDRGIGRKLKLYQRDRVREAGIAALYWTFDPLEARNAWLNLNRLGARVIDYTPHMYGEVATARTDHIIGADRFTVCWHIRDDAPPPDAPYPESASVLSLANSGSLDDDPGDSSGTEQPLLVEIPLDIQRLKSDDPGTAVAWRESTRVALMRYLHRGYLIRQLVLNARRTRAFYLLEPGGR
jgi:predicted GNAT superfamily acetyltransferase